MKTKLSFSQTQRYQMCPRSYKYHYIERIRPNVQSGALAFGTAMDVAINDLLTTNTNPEALFEETFTRQKVNEEMTYVPTAENLVYANSDFDADLLTEDDYNFIAQQAEAGVVARSSDYLETFSILRDKKKQRGLEALSKLELKLHNLMNWLCLRRKGFYMIAAYRKKVLPKIERVLAVQEYVCLENAAGDKVIGYVDLIADIKGIGPVILDNKTSSMEYAEDAVLTSPQLALYKHCLEEKFNTKKAGFIVMKKALMKNKKKVCKTCGNDGSGSRHKTCNAEIEGKRCGGEWAETIDPDVYIQILIDDIPSMTEEIVMENIDSINEAIKAKQFHRNLHSCTNWYGGNCPYLKMCYKGDDTGLTCAAPRGESEELK